MVGATATTTTTTINPKQVPVHTTTSTTWVRVLLCSSFGIHFFRHASSFWWSTWLCREKQQMIRNMDSILLHGVSSFISMVGKNMFNLGIDWTVLEANPDCDSASETSATAVCRYTNKESSFAFIQTLQLQETLGTRPRGRKDDEEGDLKNRPPLSNET